MSSITYKLADKKLITPPKFLPESIQYETYMGSIAYDVTSKTSDADLYGFCIPPKHIVFPYKENHILGFGDHPEKFEQFTQHHIMYKDSEYDIVIYNIVKYFQLCMENNPNMIDSMFTPIKCITSISDIGQMIRENRTLFLHKGAWHKFKGYAYSQMSKVKSRNPIGKRKAMVEQYGYDIKHAYHIVRLLSEVEQILLHGDLDLTLNKEQLKSIRRGEWTLSDIENYFDTKEKDLEKVYLDSKLRYSPDTDAIKQLLINCLEQYYGSIEDCVMIDGNEKKALTEIQDILNKVLR